MTRHIIIDCYLSHECGSEETLRSNIAQALSLEKVEASVNCYRIDDKQAEEFGISGSPAVLINGKELQPYKAAGFY